MRKKIFLAIGMFVLTVMNVDAQSKNKAVAIWHPKFPQINSQKGKGLCDTRVIASYNAPTTTLTVKFPSNSQGGKVEIYRSGVKVVNTSAPADASLSFVLRNYGKGDYTVIVSSGNTVVYSNYVTVK